MNPIRVLLVDDHTLFREGVKSILLLAGGRFELVGEAADGNEAQTLARRLQPDLILMDVQMPNCGGLDATRHIAPQLPSAKIIMLTVSDRDNDLYEAIKAGAKGYLLKMSASATELIDALELVAAGEVIFTPTMATKLVTEFAAITTGNRPPSSPDSRADADSESPLTEREHDVLELVATGRTNKEIAAVLNITENTVRAHLRNILDKLHLSNRVQAAVYARRRADA